MPTPMNQRNLIESFGKTLSTKGILYYLVQFIQLTYPSDDPYERLPYLVDDTTTDRLDNVYFYAYSGDCIVSPTIDKLYDFDNDTLPDSAKLELAAMFYSEYSGVLLKLWNDMQLEFNPMDNYNMHIETSETVENSSESEKHTSSENESHEGYTENDNVYGFNTDTTLDPNGVPSDYQASSTNVNSSGEGSSTVQKSGDSERSYESDKHGTTGIYSQQQLITQSLKLHEISFYRNYLFPYLDKLLVISVF